MGNNTQSMPAVLLPIGKPGEAWKPLISGPIGDGSSISQLPQFGGPPPPNVTGVPTPKLGMGTADPTVHGGG
jgi:hypothetical protein